MQKQIDAASLPETCQTMIIQCAKLYLTGHAVNSLCGILQALSVKATYFDLDFSIGAA